MTNVLTDVEQLTPLWLTRLLQKNGILQKAEVAEIYQTKSNQTNVSFVSHLAVRYTVEEPSAPAPYSSPPVLRQIQRLS